VTSRSGLDDDGEEVAPDPGALIESMRAFGYSLPTAIADLVDNSISAGASTVDIDFRWAGARSTIAVVDNGSGMTSIELREAMRLGSRSPAEVRAPNDLGRFGLGLKSAAWSQARSLTVITRPEGDRVVARRWDLDHVTQARRWHLLATVTDEGEQYLLQIEGMSHGTVVLLERADRLVGPAGPDDVAAHDRFLRAVRSTQVHLAMVFHRFLVGRGALRLSVNGSPVEPWDPFLESHPATQRLPTETIPTSTGRIEVVPYVLPHVSKLTSGDHSSAAGIAGWNGQQGFYVYRARRLLVAGGWLGLKNMQQEEHLKLARIRIDLDNSQDELWQIDVRKATARIPGPFQEQLQRIARVARKTAREAYAFRGKTVARSSERDNRLHFVWEAKTIRGGGHRFAINRSHPVLQGLMTTTADAKRIIETTLKLVEESLPVEAIVLESRENPDVVRADPFAGHGKEVLGMLQDAHAAMVAAGAEAGVALRALASVEPFDAHPEIVAVMKEELERDH
jgi:hypothetical protein